MNNSLIPLHRTVKSYIFQDIYLIEIIEDDKYWEAWFSELNYGLKTFMFGVPKVQNLDTGKKIINESEFLWMIEMELEDNLDVYIEDLYELEELIEILSENEQE